MLDTALRTNRINVCIDDLVKPDIKKCMRTIMSDQDYRFVFQHSRFTEEGCENCLAY